MSCHGVEGWNNCTPSCPACLLSTIKSKWDGEGGMWRIGRCTCDADDDDDGVRVVVAVVVVVVVGNGESTKVMEMKHRNRFTTLTIFELSKRTKRRGHVSLLCI
jgi:hypothetical protein